MDDETKARLEAIVGRSADATRDSVSDRLHRQLFLDADQRGDWGDVLVESTLKDARDAAAAAGRVWREKLSGALTVPECVSRLNALSNATAGTVPGTEGTGNAMLRRAVLLEAARLLADDGEDALYEREPPPAHAHGQGEPGGMAPYRLLGGGPSRKRPRPGNSNAGRWGNLWGPGGSSDNDEDTNEKDKEAKEEDSVMEDVNMEDDTDLEDKKIACYDDVLPVFCALPARTLTRGGGGGGSGGGVNGGGDATNANGVGVGGSSDTGGGSFSALLTASNPVLRSVHSRARLIALRELALTGKAPQPRSNDKNVGAPLRIGEASTPSGAAPRVAALGRASAALVLEHAGFTHTSARALDALVDASRRLVESMGSRLVAARELFEVSNPPVPAPLGALAKAALAASGGGAGGSVRGGASALQSYATYEARKAVSEIITSEQKLVAECRARGHQEALAAVLGQRPSAAAGASVNSTNTNTNTNAATSGDGGASTVKPPTTTTPAPKSIPDEQPAPPSMEDAALTFGRLGDADIGTIRPSVPQALAVYAMRKR